MRNRFQSHALVIVIREFLFYQGRSWNFKMTARPLQFNNDMLGLLQKVHISIPCKTLDRYMEMILRHRMNLEIVFGASQLDEVPRPRLKTLADQLHRNGIRVTFHGPFLDLCLGSIDSLIRQISKHRLQQCVDLFDIFQPIQMVCHTGYDPSHHRGLRDQWLKRSLAVWEELLPQAEKLDVVLLMENVWELDPLLHQETSRHLHSRYFGFCLDVGHQNCFSKTTLAQWVEALGEGLMELHLHDNDGSGDAHLPVGQGNIDFPGLFQCLREKERKPLLTLEPHTQEHLTESLGGLLRAMGADP